MKTAIFFLTFALSVSLYAQDSAFTFTGFDDTCNLQDLELEKETLDQEIQTLAWKNDELMDQIFRKKMQNQKISQSTHSAARIHLNQNLEDIQSFQDMIEQNNLELERKWEHSVGLDYRINSAVCQVAINP